MNNYICVLNWVHRYVENDVVVVDTTFMGAFDSEEKAKEAIEEYSRNPTYTPYCNDDVTEWGEFEIENTELNRLIGTYVVSEEVKSA